MAIEINNTVYRDGQGIPVVLVHAFPIDHHMWDECAKSIIDYADKRGIEPFALWAPDMPGAGDGSIPDSQSTGDVSEDGAYPQALDRMAEAYVNLLHNAGYSKAIWVGLSMGGYLVLNIHRLYPQAVAGIALCDTKANADSYDARISRLRIADICEKDNTVEPVLHFAEPQPTDSTIKRSAAFVSQFTEWIHNQKPQGIAWRERMAAGRPDLNDQLPRIMVPAAVICGDRDPSSSPAVMRPMADAMTRANASFTVINNCGHFSAYEHPDDVAQALVDLIERVERQNR